MKYSPDNPIPLFKVYMNSRVGEEVQKILYSGYIAQGAKVEEFEYRLRHWLDVPRILTVNSGTSALQLAATLAGLGPNQGETWVVSTPMTCTATNTALRAVGANIIWADINPETGNINPESVQDRLEEASAQGKNVKAVMAVDWGGNPCPWAELRDICDIHGVKLIEDAAHAFGMKYRGGSPALYTDYTCYSFQAIKHLTTIDGGAIICHNPADHERGKLLRWFGIDRDQPRKDFRCEADVVEPGYKYHMNDVNASVGIVNLTDMSTILSAHRYNAAELTHQLRNYQHKNPNRQFYLPDYPATESDSASAFWLYTMRVQNRAEFMKFMESKGITTSQVHARNDQHTMFAESRRELLGMNAFTANQVNIPCGWWLNGEDRAHIINTIKAWVEGA